MGSQRTGKWFLRGYGCRGDPIWSPAATATGSPNEGCRNMVLTTSGIPTKALFEGENPMADQTRFEIPTIAGVKAEYVTSPRLTTRVLFSGNEKGIPVLFV